jgi:F-type H+-transporting ATPase subunit delta
MREESVARRYAAALLDVSRKQNTLDAAQTEIKQVAAKVAETGALRALLAQPLVTQERKKQVIQNEFGAIVAPQTLAFLNLLVDKRRITLLPEVAAEFERMVRDVKNIAFATATTAVPLSSEQLAALERSLEARTGKDIELKADVDPSLMGGVLVRIGDTVLDGTVKGNLERLREQLLERK